MGVVRYKDMTTEYGTGIWDGKGKGQGDLMTIPEILAIMNEGDEAKIELARLKETEGAGV